jgi:hypothetical protein
MPRCAGRGIFNLAFSGEPAPSLRTRPLLSDYAWNHTTLWAMKADEKYTYIQCGFDPASVRDQFWQLTKHFGDEVLFHLEFMKNGTGQVIPGAIPVVRFVNEERLNALINFCRQIGVFGANPHVTMSKAADATARTTSNSWPNSGTTPRVC